MSVTLSALDIRLGSRAVLHGINARIESGELVGVIGPNGAGKSTLARAISGLLKAARGEIRLDDQPIHAVPRATLARQIAYLPQGQTVHWPLTVERLVSLGRLPHLAPFSAIAPADRAAIDRAMGRAEIEALRDRPVSELSGGERARALIARAFAVEAPVLIADEPLASLDPGHQLQLMHLLKAEAAKGSLVIAVLHDLAMATRFCDRLLLLHEGRLIADGAPASVLTAEKLRECYDINAWVGTIEGQEVVLPMSRS